MPRQKDIVGLKVSRKDLRETVIKTAIEQCEPYKTFRDPVRGGYSIVYTDPADRHTRELVMEGVEDRRTANDIRELLERAWALGRISKE